MTVICSSLYSDLPWAEWFGAQTLVGARDFLFTPIQSGPKAHPASCTVGARALTRG